MSSNVRGGVLPPRNHGKSTRTQFPTQVVLRRAGRPSVLPSFRPSVRALANGSVDFAENAANELGS